MSHGDLHYENILKSNREDWLAIDPKGYIGERAFETGILLRNPYPTLIKKLYAKEILQKRIEQLSNELSLPRERIWGWGFSQAVLSAIWCIEDRDQYVPYYIDCIKLLASLEIA